MSVPNTGSSDKHHQSPVESLSGFPLGEFHGRFLRSEDFLLQKHATLRDALRMLNSRSPSVRYSLQSSETMCNSLALNP